MFLSFYINVYLFPSFISSTFLSAPPLTPLTFRIVEVVEFTEMAADINVDCCK